MKPDDWDEDAPPKIADPDAAKPDGWLDNGPELIPDPDATPPEDWDTEEDGEWEPPMISESYGGTGMEYEHSYLAIVTRVYWFG